MQALDAATGDVIYSERIKGFSGTAFDKPGRTFEEISRTKVDPYRSMPIFRGELTSLRTQEKLMAIRSK